MMSWTREQAERILSDGGSILIGDRVYTQLADIEIFFTPEIITDQTSDLVISETSAPVLRRGRKRKADGV